VVVESSEGGVVTCVLSDPLSQHCVKQSRVVMGRRPQAFLLPALRPDTRYEVIMCTHTSPFSLLSFVSCSAVTLRLHPFPTRGPFPRLTKRFSCAFTWCVVMLWHGGVVELPRFGWRG